MKSWRCRIYSISTVVQAFHSQRGWAEHVRLKCESSGRGEAELHNRMTGGRIHPECLEAIQEEAKDINQAGYCGNVVTPRLPGSSSKILGWAPSVFSGLDRAKSRTGGKGEAGQRYILQWKRTSSRGLLNRLQNIMVWEEGQCGCWIVSQKWHLYEAKKANIWLANSMMCKYI